MNNQYSRKGFWCLWLAIFLWVGCQSPNSEMETLRVELVSANKKLDSLQVLALKNTSEGIVHTVFLSLKDDVTEAEQTTFKTLLESLERIDEVQLLIVADRMDVGDVRALDYDIVLYAIFKNEEALKVYDSNEYHNEVRAQLITYLSGPPATFDYKL